MEIKEGKYTVERFASERGLSRQSAINLLSKLKKKGLVEVSGGGKQKRIYAIHELPKRKTNGFYDIVNRYSPEKLRPGFEHYVSGNYTIEHAIIDGVRIGDSRTLQATSYLFRHVRDWKRLFDLAKKQGVEDSIVALYKQARGYMRVRRMPERYLN
ncbi:hypothetical protein HY640_03910 [Candidatus Woesearchaeota archaeon]|nr:hypothetical protein [Candidatus Woesearchaeota archaeon]